jgi:hypothetical protein
VCCCCANTGTSRQCCYCYPETMEAHSTNEETSAGKRHFGVSGTCPWMGDSSMGSTHYCWEDWRKGEGAASPGWLVEDLGRLDFQRTWTVFGAFWYEFGRCFFSTGYWRLVELCWIPLEIALFFTYLARYSIWQVASYEHVHSLTVAMCPIMVACVIMFCSASG